MAYYESKRLIWSNKEFTLKEIIERYSEYLPFLVVITQGYSSSRLEIAADQIFWIRDIARQPRLVAKNQRGRYFSIPECYKQQVQQMIRIDAEQFIPVGDPITVKELMAKEHARYFKLIGGSSQEVVCETNESFHLEVGHLELMDVYEEKYLVVHPLFSDEGQNSVGSLKKHFMVHPQLFMIPADIPMTLSIAVGMKRGSDRKFFQIMLNMKRFADCCDKDYTKHIAKNAAIMTFTEAPASNTYEYIELSALSRCRGEKTGPKLLAHRDHDAYTSLSRDLQDTSLDYEYIVLVEGKQREGQGKRISLEERLKMLQQVYTAGRVSSDETGETRVVSGADGQKLGGDGCSRPASKSPDRAATRGRGSQMEPGKDKSKITVYL